MKRLEIKNFVKGMDEIYSDYFNIKYCSDAGDKYLIGIDTDDVVSFMSLRKKHYKMSIDKEWRNEDDGYKVWLWDVEANVSYPMSINRNALSNSSEFTSFLNHTIKLADEGSFSGTPGNRIK